jgi:hypothetical protein
MTLKLQGTNTVAAPGVSNDGNDGVVVGTDSIELSIAGASKAKLNSAGNFVLGGSSNTTDQGYRFTLQGSANASYFQLFDSTTGTTHGSDGTFIGLINGDSYFYNREAKATIFGTSNNERMRIASDGKVGIGTTSPGFKLTVSSDENNLFLKQDTGDHGYILDVNQGDGTLSFNRRVSGSDTGIMRLDNNGSVYIGKTAASETTNGFHLSASNGANYVMPSNHYFIFNRNASGAATLIDFRSENTGKGSIAYNGTNIAYNTTSDYRLKENKVTISDGITRLKTLKPYRFNFKSNPSMTVDGFYAHEITAVPEAVTGTKDEVDDDNNPVYQGIDQSKLVPLLTAALQEAIGKIEVLETKVATLEGS